MAEVTEKLPDLTGKVAVITGASQGLGADLARNFAARGMKLMGLPRPRTGAGVPP